MYTYPTYGREARTRHLYTPEDYEALEEATEEALAVVPGQDAARTPLCTDHGGVERATPWPGGRDRRLVRVREYEVANLATFLMHPTTSAECAHATAEHLGTDLETMAGQVEATDGVRGIPVPPREVVDRHPLDLLTESEGKAGALAELDGQTRSMYHRVGLGQDHEE
jgi:hypothetical protein